MRGREVSAEDGGKGEITGHRESSEEWRGENERG